MKNRFLLFLSVMLLSIVLVSCGTKSDTSTLTDTKVTTAGAVITTQQGEITTSQTAGDTAVRPTPSTASTASGSGSEISSTSPSTTEAPTSTLQSSNVTPPQTTTSSDVAKPPMPQSSEGATTTVSPVITETPDTEIINTETDVKAGDYEFSKGDMKTEYGSLTADIELKGTTAVFSGEGVTVSGSTVTITKGGSYRMTGTLSDGRIIINASKEDKIRLVFNTVTLHSESGSPLYIKSCDKVFLTLAENSVNMVSDDKTYTFTDGDVTPDGAIFSREDLTINAESGGALTVNGNHKHGIVSKDDLVITGGMITVIAQKVALAGKDAVKIGGGEIKLTAGSDGIRADNTEDTTKGFVYLHDGELTIQAENDGIQAETSLLIDGGSVSVKTGNGAPTSSRGYSGTDSKKGLKAGGEITVSGGTVILDCEDDAIHCNNTVTVTHGSVTAASGDDGIHADSCLSLSGGSVTVTKSYEGLEAQIILISSGKHSITASDDGLNASSGSSDENDFGGWWGGGGGGMQADPDCSLTISGGYLLVNAAGDGLDSNGDLTVTGGTVLVAGPTNSGNGALDYGGTSKITGGTLIALGASGMAEGFKEGNIGSFLTTFTSQSAGKLFAVTDSEGNVIASFTAPKSYNSAVVASDLILKGESYTIVIGGSVTDADENGFTESGKLTGGSQITTVTMSSLIQNSGGMGGGPGSRPPRG